MTGFLIKRVLQAVFVIVAVTLLVSYAVRLTGDPALMLSQGSGSVTEQDLANIRQALGLNRPFHEQYLGYMQGLLHGDFGRSFMGGTSVAKLIGDALPATLMLAFTSLIASILISLPLGIQAAIKRDAGNVQAYMVLMELRAANGADRAELAGILRKAVDGAPSSPIPRQLLVDHYLRGGETKEALAVAQQAVAALPDNAQLFDALGRAQSANGHHNQALASFNRMAALQPQSPEPYLRMAGANLIAGDRTAAGQSWRKALEIDPRALEAQQGLVRLAMAERKSDDALAMSRTVQKQRPKEAAGYALEGEIHVAEKAWDKAIDVFRAGLKQVPASGELAVRLHEVLVTAGKKSEADRLATEWQRSHAKDATFPLYLGTRALAAKDLTPSYWINMGAMAISTLAGALLVQAAPQAPFLQSMHPFIEGFTLFCWASGTWWIPLLIVLEVWRYAIRHVPLRYDPMYWGVVFPLGMYAVCTRELTRALGLNVIDALPPLFGLAALLAWLLAGADSLLRAWQWGVGRRARH